MKFLAYCVVVVTDFQLLQDRHCLYKVTLRHNRSAVVVMENQ